MLEPGDDTLDFLKEKLGDVHGQHLDAEWSEFGDYIECMNVEWSEFREYGECTLSGENLASMQSP